MNKKEIINYMNKNFLGLGNKQINTGFSKNIINQLNKEKLIIINGFKWISKTNIISSIIQKTNLKDSFLYINKDYDLNNLLKTNLDLNELINSFQEEKKLKLIILENVDKIENIKKYITEVYQKGYKIIIIGNDIKVGNKPQIEFFEEKKDFFSYFGQDKLEQKQYFSINNIITNKTNSLLLTEIFSPYSIKNFDLYNYVLKILAGTNMLDSMRNFYKNTNQKIKLSQVTYLEYIKYSLQAKIIKQVFLYDFKKDKKIETKSKIYFSNIDFRNSLYNFLLSKNTLKENFLFLELEKRGFNIFSGKNGTYDFCFFAKKKVSDGVLQESLFIDFCNTQNKQEFKKQLNKLLKVPNPKNTISKKFLITDSIKELSIKKTKYENLEILSFDELLKKM